jgi:hypothetical protein
VVQGSNASRRAVTLGAQDQTTGTIVIATGIAAGDQVIVTPSAALTDGARVQVGARTEPAAVKAREN